jgi:hypothetical protein
MEVVQVQEKLSKTKKTLTGSTAASLIAAGALALGLVGTASAADLVDIQLPVDRSNLERSIDAAELRDEYRHTYRNAKKLGVAPKRNAAEGEIVPARLDRELTQLRKDVKQARQAKKKAAAKAEKAKAAAPKVDDPEDVGVATGTLESIAACESGGDPGAVSSDGSYRGKYQFDYGTWASVGGSGDPAAASESEQDYRAALLYSRAGSSPWPVCGS